MEIYLTEFEVTSDRKSLNCQKSDAILLKFVKKKVAL